MLGAAIGSVIRQEAFVLERDSSVPEEPTFLYRYPLASPLADYLRPVVKLEFGARSDTHPRVNREIRSFVAEEFPELGGKEPIPVPCVAPERTFLEKAFLIHEALCGGSAHVAEPRLSRHLYDLCCMIEASVGDRAFQTSALYREVLAHRQVFFPQSDVDYELLTPSTLRLAPQRSEEAAWKADYLAMITYFPEEPPAWEQLMRTLRAFESQLRSA